MDLFATSMQLLIADLRMGAPALCLSEWKGKQLGIIGDWEPPLCQLCCVAGAPFAGGTLMSSITMSGAGSWLLGANLYSEEALASVPRLS